MEAGMFQQNQLPVTSDDKVPPSVLQFTAISLANLLLQGLPLHDALAAPQWLFMTAISVDALSLLSTFLKPLGKKMHQKVSDG